MKQYDFDYTPSRWNTFSLKWDIKPNELPMWVADMDFETAPEVKEAMIKRAEHGIYGYSIIPEEFFSSIQSWWKKRHHVEWKREWMIYSSGIVAAISSIVRRFIKKGDSVLIQSPVFNIFYNSILNNQGTVLSNDLVYKDGKYSIDFIDLEEKLSLESTKMMILCNPHNPVGKIWSVEELTRIATLCKKYNVLLLSDEIHCEFVRPGLHYNSLGLLDSDLLDNAIILVAASKTFNLAGLQSACVIVPNERIRKIVDRGLNTDEVAEPNAFSMIANIAAFTYGEKWVDALIEYIDQNRKYATEFIHTHLSHLHLVEQEATYLLWIDISYYSSNSVEFVEELRKETGLYVSDGMEYGLNGASFIRVNIATSKKNVEDGMHRLEMFIQKKENKTL
mgnify:FL=1